MKKEARFISELVSNGSLKTADCALFWHLYSCSDDHGFIDVTTGELTKGLNKSYSRIKSQVNNLYDVNLITPVYVVKTKKGFKHIEGDYKKVLKIGSRNLIKTCYRITLDKAMSEGAN